MQKWAASIAYAVLLSFDRTNRQWLLDIFRVTSQVSVTPIDEVLRAHYTDNEPIQVGIWCAERFVD